MEFWEVYDRHYARVRGYAASMLRDPAAGDDVVQETFIRAQAHLGALREPEKMAAWLLRIAHNLCMDHLRARQSSRIDPAADLDVLSAVEAASLEQDLERRQMSDCVRGMIERLPDNDRAVILLFDIEGLSHEEIAGILGIDAGAVKVRLHRARKKLRAVLEDGCSFDRDERDVLICEPRPPKE
jgi:RNA polymerase sigma-70 factor (ECF subfamily)